MMIKRTVPALLAGALVVGLASPALALDGWGDRRGMFFGLTLGGGAVSNAVEEAGTTYESDTEFGFNLRARVGGGATKQLTLDGEVGMNVHSESRSANGFTTDTSWKLYTTYIGVNYFPIESQGFYIRGMGGLAIASFELDNNITGTKSESQTGVGFGFGAGYEFFANANLAAGVGADWQQMNIEDNTFTMFSVGVTGTWY